MSAKILEGNCLETLKTLSACSVQCVVTSPPYYGLRDYGVEGQIGMEDTPEAYVENLVAVFRECFRVLKDDGTLWLNLGDSYWGGKGQSAHGGSEKQRARFERNESISREYQEIGRHGWTAPKDGKHPVIKPKDLVGIPWMVAFALRADGWYLRSEIIWAKPNPMPESMKDRPTKSHEQIFLFSKSPDYFYDYEAILEPYSEPLDRWGGDNKRKAINEKHDEAGKANANSLARPRDMRPNKNGRNKRDVWTVTTKPYSGAHFATFPTELIEPCILAGTKEGDTVLDPFNGSGTTGEVSIKYHRLYIGCELNPKYVKLTHRRLSQVQPVLMQGRSLTPCEPDNGDSAPSQAFSTPDFLSDLEGLS